MSFSLRNIPVQAYDSRTQGFSPPLARRRSSCPPPSSNLVRTHPIEHYQALRDSAPCLSRAATPEEHQIGARTRCAPGNTILNQPYRCRVSTDRLNRDGSQLAASLEGEPGPTPGGKTLPHSYPETRFRRERARGVDVLEPGELFIREARYPFFKLIQEPFFPLLYHRFFHSMKSFFRKPDRPAALTRGKSWYPT